MALLALIGSCVLALAAAVFAAVLLRERSMRLAAEGGVSAMRARSMATNRLLGLAAGEIRGLALTLLGHAQAEPPVTGEAVAGLAHRLRGISEDLLQQSGSMQAARSLTEEVMDVAAALEFAVAQVAARLGPGQRAWRITSVPHGTRLLADRRALNQILVNVLSSAASSTGEGDWIDVSVYADERSWVLQVDDEGVGMQLGGASPSPAGPSDAGAFQMGALQMGGFGDGGRFGQIGQPGQLGAGEHRGLGYGLTLARSLMLAHDGELAVESAPRVGTRVRLIFSPARDRSHRIQEAA